MTTTELCEDAVLKHLSSSPDAAIDDTYPWSLQQGLKHETVVGALKSLLADEYVATEDLATAFLSFEKEADSILKDGSQEIRVLQALASAEGQKLSVANLQSAVGKDVAKIGMGNCLKNKWIRKDGGDLVAAKSPDDVEDEVRLLLQAIQNADFAGDALDDKVRIIADAVVP